MPEYISEELLRKRASWINESQDVIDEIVSSAMEINARYESDNLVTRDYSEIDDAEKGMRAGWAIERGIELLVWKREQERQQLLQKREEMIRQEMGINGAAPQQQPIQPIQAAPVTLIQLLLMGIGVAAICFAFSYSLYKRSISEEEYEEGQ